MKLSVLIPVFNEAESIVPLIGRVAAVDLHTEIIVVDDASTDGTRNRLDEVSVEAVRVIHHPANRGKGAAVRTALDAAEGDAVVIQDADLEYYPEDFPLLMDRLTRGDVEAVYGVRDLSSQPAGRRIGNQVLTATTNLLFGSRLHDMETCYKMMTIDAARSLGLSAERFDIEPEITAKLLKKRYRIGEVPIRYSPRGTRKLNPIRDGPHALWRLVQLRFQG